MTLPRIIAALALLAVAGFCLFGFLATYEPPGWPVLRVAYAVAGAGCLVGAGLLALGRRRSGDSREV